MRSQKFARTLGTALLLLFLVEAIGAASASQVTIGQSTAGLIVFQNVAAQSADFFFTANCGYADCISGLAYQNQNAGTYSLWISGANPSLAISGIQDEYQVNQGGPIWFTFQIGQSALSGQVSLALVTGVSSEVPTFIGSLKVTASTIDGFEVGQILPFDFSIFLGNNNNTVSAVLNSSSMGTSTAGAISSGELVLAPEPPALALGGGLMLLVAGLLRSRHHKHS